MAGAEAAAVTDRDQHRGREASSTALEQEESVPPESAQLISWSPRGRLYLTLLADLVVSCHL